MVENLVAMQETRVRSLGWEDPLEKETATHSSILAWKIQRAVEAGGLQPMKLQRADTTEQLNSNNWYKIYEHFGSDGKASVCNAGDPGSIPGLGRSPGEGNGSPLQYSCLENPMDGGAW